MATTAETAHELLLDVIELDLERGAAQSKDGGGHVHELAVRELLDERLVAGRLHELGDAIHGAIDVPHFPFGRAWCAVQDLRRAIRIDVELEDRRSLRAECALVERTVGIALDVDDLPVDRVYEGGAADGAIRTDARCHLRILDAELLRLGDDRSEWDPGADEAPQCSTAGGASGIAEKVSSCHFHGDTPLTRERDGR